MNEPNKKTPKQPKPCLPASHAIYTQTKTKTRPEKAPCIHSYQSSLLDQSLVKTHATLVTPRHPHATSRHVTPRHAWAGQQQELPLRENKSTERKRMREGGGETQQHLDRSIELSARCPPLESFAIILPAPPFAPSPLAPPNLDSISSLRPPIKFHPPTPSRLVPPKTPWPKRKVREKRPT